MRKGDSYALDNRSNISSTVAAWTSNKLHDGRIDPHPAGSCHYHCGGQSHSGTQILVMRLHQPVRSFIMQKPDSIGSGLCIKVFSFT
jgi:hypothetical protein